MAIAARALFLLAFLIRKTTLFIEVEQVFWHLYIGGSIIRFYEASLGCIGFCGP